MKKLIVCVALFLAGLLEGTPNSELTDPVGEVYGRVLVNGEPVVGAKVRLVRTPSLEFLDSPYPALRTPLTWGVGLGLGTVTGLDGSFILHVAQHTETQLADDRLGLYVWSDGWSATVGGSLLGSANAGEIHLVPPGAVLGRAVAEAETDWNDYQIVAIREYSSPLSQYFPGSFSLTTTGDSGEFSFTSLPAGDWIIGLISRPKQDRLHLLLAPSQMIDSELVSIGKGTTELPRPLHVDGEPDGGLELLVRASTGENEGVFAVYVGGSPWICAEQNGKWVDGMLKVTALVSGEYCVVSTTRSYGLDPNVANRIVAKGTWVGGSQPVSVSPP